MTHEELRHKTLAFVSAHKYNLRQIIAMLDRGDDARPFILDLAGMFEDAEKALQDEGPPHSA